MGSKEGGHGGHGGRWGGWDRQASWGAIVDLGSAGGLGFAGRAAWCGVGRWLVGLGWVVVWVWVWMWMWVDAGLALFAFSLSLMCLIGKWPRRSRHGSPKRGVRRDGEVEVAQSGSWELGAGSRELSSPCRTWLSLARPETMELACQGGSKVHHITCTLSALQPTAAGDEIDGWRWMDVDGIGDGMGWMERDGGH